MCASDAHRQFLVRAMMGIVLARKRRATLNPPFYGSSFVIMMRNFRSRQITAFGYRPITKSATINAR
jgi:hypothetical protein